MTMWQQVQNLQFKTLKCPVGGSGMAEQAALVLVSSWRSADLSHLLRAEGLLPCCHM